MIKTLNMNTIKSAKELVQKVLTVHIEMSFFVKMMSNVQNLILIIQNAKKPQNMDII